MAPDIKMTVAGITLDSTNNMPIIILKSEDEEVAIPIWIGLIEASAIATELEGIKLGRPMTHDLLKNILEGLGGTLKRIVVNDLKENTFYASLFVELNQAVAGAEGGEDLDVALEALLQRRVDRPLLRHQQDT